jgi:hypothetical protein
MKMSHITIPASIAVLGCITSGCVTHTTIKDESRQSVHFSSPEAAQTFYDAYLSGNNLKGDGYVAVYVALPYEHRTVSTDNVRFNSAVQAADSNRDGMISEEEARAFAAQRHTGKLALLK